jgi:hypothetical protein
MAGAGYKTFAVGEKLTANNVNTYLMDQTIPVFATTAARDSAIGSPAEGQTVYITLNDIYQYYNGSSWQNLLFAGAWIAYTPTLTNFTLGTGSTSAFYYQIIGKQVNVRGRIILGTGGSLGGIPSFTLPVNCVLSNQFWNPSVRLLDFGTETYLGQVSLSTTGAQINCIGASGTYATSLSVNGSRPMTWAVNDQIDISFSYEAA